MVCDIAVALLAYQADRNPQPTGEVRTVYIAPMANAPILGSQDERVGLTLGVQWARPEKRLTMYGKRIYLVFETQIAHTYGGGWRARPRDKTWTIATLGLGRYETRGPSGRGTYFEAGWGLHWASDYTWDLDSRISSTPTAGAGILVRHGNNDYQLGLRWYHISNAGLRGSNQGQNQFLLMLGVRF